MSSSPVLSVLGNVALGGIALASLFGEWSEQTMANGANALNVVTWTSGQFEMESCFIKQGAAYEADLATHNFCSKTTVHDFLEVNDFDKETNTIAIVSTSFAVIATALALINAFFSAKALLASSFASADGAVRSATANGVYYNFIGAAAWIISWATYTTFANALEDALAQIEAGNKSPFDQAVDSEYGSGFALAVIMSGLTLIIGAINLLVARSPVEAKGHGSATGNWFSFATILSVVTAGTAIASMSTHWFELDTADVQPQNYYGESAPAAENKRTLSLGLYFGQECDSVWSHIGEEATLAASAPVLTHLNCENAIDMAEFEMWEVKEGEDEEGMEDAAQSELENAAHDFNEEFTALISVVGAFSAATLAVSTIGSFLAFNVVVRAKAGDASAVSSNVGFFTATTAFYVFFLNTLLSAVTWTIGAAIGWDLLEGFTANPTTKYDAWIFGEGFILSIISGILSFFTSYALYNTLATVGNTPVFVDHIMALFLNMITRTGSAAAGAPKVELESKPKAGAAATATLRSTFISVAIAAAGFAALFGEWETTHIELVNAEGYSTLVNDYSYGLYELEECDAFNWVPYANKNLINATTLENTLAYEARSLECQSWGLDSYTYPLPDLQNSLMRVALAFTVAATFVGLVGAYFAFIAAATKPSVLATTINLVTAVVGLVFWPIAWASYTKVSVMDLEWAETVGVPKIFVEYDTVEIAEAEVEFGYGFVLAVVANGLCLLWVLDHFLFTAKAEAEAGGDAVAEKAAEVAV